MLSRRESNCALVEGNTARVTMSNPRTGHMQCVDVYAHPQGITDAVITFAHNQGICPTEVEMSTLWPKESNFRHSAPVIGEGRPRKVSEALW